jgi:preprotein translocase subunit SecD
MSTDGGFRSTISRFLFACLIFFLVFGPVCTSAAEKFTLEVASAEPALDQRTKQPIVSIKFAKSSASKLAEISSANVGKPMQFRADGQVVAKAVIREPLLGGSLQISGNFTVEQTQDIANRLVPGSSIEAEIVDQ